MIIKLPTIVKKEWNETENKLEVVKGEIEVEIDTSFKAHLKWEEQFAKSMGGIDLQTYTARVQNIIKDEATSKAEMLSLLKLLYCYINSDRLPTFKDFLGLFDYEIADEILNKLGTVLEEVGKSATKN